MQLEVQAPLGALELQVPQERQDSQGRQVQQGHGVVQGLLVLEILDQLEAGET